MYGTVISTIHLTVDQCDHLKYFIQDFFKQIGGKFGQTLSKFPTNLCEKNLEI